MDADGYIRYRCVCILYIVNIYMDLNPPLDRNVTMQFGIYRDEWMYTYGVRCVCIGRKFDMYILYAEISGASKTFEGK